MGGDVHRRPWPVQVEGQLSHVAARRSASEGPSLEQLLCRPYASAPSEQELLDNACTDPGPMTCLLAGNRIRMADGRRIPIEQVRTGDGVMTMSGPRRVEKAETTTLGLTRRVLEIRGLGDQVLLFSSDHPLWVSRTGPGGVRKEWWGTWNIHHFLYELHQGAGPGLRELPFVLHIDLPEQVAHESGWLQVRPIFHDLPRDTVLHHLVVQDGCSYIAEGFAVHSHTRDQQAPDAPWRGLDDGVAAAAAVDVVLAGA